MVHISWNSIFSGIRWAFQQYYATYGWWGGPCPQLPDSSSMGPAVGGCTILRPRWFSTIGNANVKDSLQGSACKYTFLWRERYSLQFILTKWVFCFIFSFRNVLPVAELLDVLKTLRIIAECVITLLSPPPARML